MASFRGMFVPAHETPKFFLRNFVPLFSHSLTIFGSMKTIGPMSFDLVGVKPCMFESTSKIQGSQPKGVVLLSAAGCCVHTVQTQSILPLVPNKERLMPAPPPP